MLLAVDLGLHTGLALYGSDGRLIWYRSHHYGRAADLRRGIFLLLNQLPQLELIILEGGGKLAAGWINEATRRGIALRQISAETWRAQLLYQREQRNGTQAKQHAEELARKVIEWSGTTRPTALRHDTAEAILIGLWAALELGWLEHLPPEIRRAAPVRAQGS